MPLKLSADEISALKEPYSPHPGAWIQLDLSAPAFPDRQTEKEGSSRVEDAQIVIRKTGSHFFC